MADLILTGGRIWTGNPRTPNVAAVVINGGTIVFAGSERDALRYRGANTRMIELAGRCAVPGFNDAHVHFSTGGFSLASVQLRHCRSEAELRKTIGDFAERRPTSYWILHGEWDPESWASRRLPSASTIDGVTPHHPVFVRRIDAHTALANTLAMRLAGIDRNTPDVPGGWIERDASGEPTGIFKDAALSLIERVIPQPSIAETTEAIDAAQRYAVRHGVTSVHDMGIIGGGVREHVTLLDAYRALRDQNNLHVRVNCHLPLGVWLGHSDASAMAGIESDKLRVRTLKGFSDGSLGSRTAWFYAPYDDSPATSGMRSKEMNTDEMAYQLLRDADMAGFQLAIHAIGERANHFLLDAYERLQSEHPRVGRRPRIEHAQHLLAADFARFRDLGVIASVQPYHCIDDGCWLESTLGPERASRSYAFRSLLDNGAALAVGTDWPVEPLDPMRTLYAAVTRKTLDGKNPDGWFPDQRISLEAALSAYTAGSAYASHEEQVKGTLEEGRFADVAVLSKDIFSLDASEIASIAVDMTIVAGSVAYERDGT